MGTLLGIIGVTTVCYLIYRKCEHRNRQERMIAQYNKDRDARNQMQYYNMNFVIPNTQQPTLNDRSQYALSQ
jgi:hypothetical protein